MKISRIGFGCWAVGGHGYGRVDDNDSIKAVRKALDLGINFFDTADIYGFGHSEEILCKALGEDRHNVIIGTKFGVAWDDAGKTYKDCSPSHILAALEGSLRRLRLETIPLYQLHWHDGRTPMEDIMDVLIKCQDEGKIRQIGVSNLPEDFLDNEQISRYIKTNQCLYNLVHRENEPMMRLSIDKFGHDILAYSVIGRGVFSGKYTSMSIFGKNDTRTKDTNFSGNRYKKDISIANQLKLIGKNYNKTAAQVAIRWVLDSKLISSAIVGIKSEVQAIENAGATGWNLTSEDRNVINLTVAATT